MKYLPDLSWDICVMKEVVSDSFGLSILANKVNSSLKDYDVVIIPGGLGTRKLLFNQPFINWVKTANDKVLKKSICTGNLILGVAGFLEGKKATTNYQEYNALKPYCKEVL